MTAIILSPFSNSVLRDWPAASFVGLIGLLLDGEPSLAIHVVGAAGQRLRANEIVRRFDAARVHNQCGRMAWSEVEAAVQTAACVVGNNSGIPHLAGLFGTPTVCVFGGSHQRIEWRPRGASVVLVSRAIACSPCHLDHTGRCPYGKACLTEITPEDVYAAVRLALSRSGGEGAIPSHDGTRVLQDRRI